MKTGAGSAPRPRETTCKDVSGKRVKMSAADDLTHVAKRNHFQLVPSGASFGEAEFFLDSWKVYPFKQNFINSGKLYKIYMFLPHYLKHIVHN